MWRWAAVTLTLGSPARGVQIVGRLTLYFPPCVLACLPSPQRCVAHHPDAAGPQAAHTQRRGAGQPDGAAAPALLSWRSLRWQAPPRLPACLQALHATLNNEPHESSPAKVAAEKLPSFMSLVSCPSPPWASATACGPPFMSSPRHSSSFCTIKQWLSILWRHSRPSHSLPLNRILLCFIVAGLARRLTSPSNLIPRYPRLMRFPAHLLYAPHHLSLTRTSARRVPPHSLFLPPPSE